MDVHHRALLLLAHGILEYQSVIENLRALQKAGVTVPLERIIERIETEQRSLMTRWLVEHGDPFSPRGREEQVISEARDWLSGKLGELDDLLTSEREGT